MSLDLYRRVLSETKISGITNLHFTSAQGEPLLSPHFAECLKRAIEDGFNVRLISGRLPYGCPLSARSCRRAGRCSRAAV
jgi:hypothetical protein